MKPPPPTIESDLFCLRCGYNLRTLPPNGNCPECNEAIWRTRLTRPDIRAFRRFERGREFYGLAVLACFCASWLVSSNFPHTTNGGAPEVVQLRELLGSFAVASWALTVAGMAWLGVSRYPRGSRFVWAMVGLSCLTSLFLSMVSVT